MKKKITTNVSLGAKCLARRRRAVLVLISKEEEADSWRKRCYFRLLYNIFGTINMALRSQEGGDFDNIIFFK